MMQRELIDKYFRNECSKEEKKLVLEYFRNNPEEWNKYVNEDDWDNFVTNEELAPGLSEKLFREVSKQTFKRSKRPIWLAAAAIALLVMVSLWNYVDVSKTYIVKDEVTMSERKNGSDTLMHILLDDGSMVILSPASSIRYNDPFERTIYLSGKALFEVGQHKSRPFIVYADKLATTVLGTSFTIESFAENSVIKVKLHKGKVQVAAADTLQKKWNDKEMLRPGDELTYDKATMLASIKRYMPKEQMVKAGPAKNNNQSVRRPDLYTFDISPLSDVFDQLSNYYQVDLYYYPADIQNKYFSGRMHKTDALETILNDIAVLNQLTIEKKEGQYIIRKKD